MSYIFKRKRPDGKTSRYWYAELDGKIFSLRLTERAAAQSRLVELMKEKELEKTGMIAPRTVREAFKISLLDHLEEFLDEKIREGRSKMRVSCLKIFLNRLFKECNWKKLEDFQASSFLKWRLSHNELSAKTHNEYLGALMTFCNVLLKQGKLLHNPFVSVGYIETRGQKTFYRRALTDAEQSKLFSVPNVERRIMYLLALNTGLRHGEIEKLEWTDFKFDSPKPVIKLRSAITKNKKSFNLPLNTVLIQILKEYQNGKISGLVFPHKYRFGRDMKQDWESVGISVYDEHGKKADFHSLRVTFCTNLQKSGVSFQLAQILMRHSDYRLTSEIYTDSGAFDLHLAVNSLPLLVSEKCIVKCIVNIGVEGGKTLHNDSVINIENLENQLQKTLKSEQDSEFEKIKLAPALGFEPRTKWLTATYSTAELCRNT